MNNPNVDVNHAGGYCANGLLCCLASVLMLQNECSFGYEF